MENPSMEPINRAVDALRESVPFLTNAALRTTALSELVDELQIVLTTFGISYDKEELEAVKERRKPETPDQLGPVNGIKAVKRENFFRFEGEKPCMELLQRNPLLPPFDPSAEEPLVDLGDDGDYEKLGMIIPMRGPDGWFYQVQRGPIEPEEGSPQEGLYVKGFPSIEAAFGYAVYVYSQ